MQKKWRRSFKNQQAMDVSHYDLDLNIDPHSKSIQGSVLIHFQMHEITPSIEIDLLERFSVTGVTINGMSLGFSREKNKVYIDNPGLDPFKIHKLKVTYGGKPLRLKILHGMVDLLGNAAKMVLHGWECLVNQTVPISGTHAKSILATKLIAQI